MICLPEVVSSDRGDGDLHLHGSGMTRPIIALYCGSFELGLL